MAETCPDCARPRAASIDAWVNDAECNALCIPEGATLNDYECKTRALTREREARQKAEALAYIGEHHFPDQTWKARAEELRAQLAAKDAEVASIREERNKYARRCTDRDNELAALRGAKDGATQANAGLRALLSRLDTAAPPAGEATTTPSLPVPAQGHDASDHEKCKDGECDFATMAAAGFPRGAAPAPAPVTGHTFSPIADRQDAACWICYRTREEHAPAPVTCSAGKAGCRIGVKHEHLSLAEASRRFYAPDHAPVTSAREGCFSCDASGPCTAHQTAAVIGAPMSEQEKADRQAALEARRGEFCFAAPAYDRCACGHQRASHATDLGSKPYCEIPDCACNDFTHAPADAGKPEEVCHDCGRAALDSSHPLDVVECTHAPAAEQPALVVCDGQRVNPVHPPPHEVHAERTTCLNPRPAPAKEEP